MDRKEFLTLCWRKLIKPLIYIIGIVFCINFLLNGFKESGTERFILIISFGLALLFAVASIVGFLTSNLKEMISKRLSSKNKERLWIISRVLDHVSILAFGGVIYYFYERNEWNSVLILSVIEIHRIYKIVKERKTATNTI